VTLRIANRQISIPRDALNLASNAAAILLGILAVFIALRNPERRARVSRTLTSIGQAVRLTTGSQGHKLRSGDLIQLGPVEFRFYYANDFQNLSQGASEPRDDTLPKDDQFGPYGAT